jgi:8-oxo-dGTP diphosphatase
MEDLFDSLIAKALEPGLTQRGQPDEPQAPSLRSERLALRPLTAADAPEFHRLINDWDICRKLPDAPFPYPETLAARWIAAAAADRAAGRAQQFAVTLLGDGRMIGCAGLRLTKSGHGAELGYWIGRKHWRQGYGLEAARRLAAWGLAELPIREVTATVAADNEGSIAVLRRAGFKQTGKGRQAFQCRAEARLPVLHFALAREEPELPAAPAREVLLVAACALIDPAGRILLARRPEGKKMAGLWEFPGGKIAPGETPEAALVRELQEELGIAVAAADLGPFTFASHAYDGFHLLMPLYLCRRWRGEPKPKEGQALAWVAPDRLIEYPMPAADRPLIPMLRDFL